MEKQNSNQSKSLREMLQKNDLVRLGAILFAITLSVGLLLSGVNALTKDRIAQIDEQNKQAAMKLIFADATFEKIDFTPTGIVSEIYGAYKGNEKLGTVIASHPAGFGGAIDMLVGMDETGAVIGFEITKMNETPGLGTKTKEPAFKDQFAGKTGALVVTKAASQPNEIAAISGATISSTAVTNGISAALEAARSIK